MQSTTHFLVGIWIFRACSLLETMGVPFWIIIILSTILAILSHVLLDCLAKMTYHMPEPQYHDVFWVSYHVVFVYGGTLALLILYFSNYWWVMLAAILPDIIDWYIRRPLLKKGPIIHPQIDKLRNRWFSWIPDLTAKKWTVVLEIGLDVILFVLLIVFAQI
ncbi:MAG: hypothetical protein ACTSWC_06505 [Promethearchaeota archaeon]